MGSTPDKPEPSEAERASAEIGAREYTKYKNLYTPLLLEQRDKSNSEDGTNIARGRANADTMQALANTDVQTGGQFRTDLSAKATDALTSQLGNASTAAEKAKANKQVQVLNAAQKQGQTAQQGLSTLARLGTSKALADLQADSTVQAAKMGAIGQIAGSAATAGASKGMFGKNIQQGVNNYYGIEA